MLHLFCLFLRHNDGVFFRSICYIYSVCFYAIMMESFSDPCYIYSVCFYAIMTESFSDPCYIYSVCFYAIMMESFLDPYYIYSVCFCQHSSDPRYGNNGRAEQEVVLSPLLSNGSYCPYEHHSPLPAGGAVSHSSVSVFSGFDPFGGAIISTLASF